MASVKVENDIIPLLTPSNVFVRGTPGFAQKQNQYAFTSYPDRMDPKLIVYAQNVDDIKGIIKYAKDKKIAVAIRSGGHQYSGASSTTGDNILLDLSQTFRGPEDLTCKKTDTTATVRASVSYSLKEFNAFLQEKKVFIPHGQCATVHLGGHVQTGGYGQMGRSFGLLADHVTELEIVDYDAKEKTVTKDTDPDLFKAILGGSPGNFGVIKHFTINVYQDKDFRGSIGLKCMFLYKRATLERLLTYLAEMSDNPNFDRNYDLCVNVVSSRNNLASYFPEMENDKDFVNKHPEFFDGKQPPPSFISVYAQWVPFNDSLKCDFGWFRKLEQGSIYAEADTTGSNPPWSVMSMSALSGYWLFPLEREFPYPYIKTTRATNATDLIARKWPEWLSGRINEIVGVNKNGCYLAVQVQPFGGVNSQYRKNKDKGLSYGWRDATVIATIDCFYADEAADGTVPKDTAKAWFLKNEREAISEGDRKGFFSDKDQRVLWGSFGEYKLDKVWDKYYDDETVYKKLLAVREKEDPDRVFTPNTFCVGFEEKTPITLPVGSPKRN